jgi:hypothetical protein
LRTSKALLDAEGGAVGVQEVANLLGLSRQAVNKRRRNGTLLAVSLGRRGYLYPVWQFATGGVLPGLRGVLEDLKGHDSWMQLAFMLNPSPCLEGESPLAELRRGNIDAVRVAARSYGEHGPA